MNLFRVIVLSILLISNSNAQEDQRFCNTDNEVRYINTALGKQKIMIFEPKDGQAKELIFFFHGDSPFGPPSYQYDMARRIVEFREGAMAVAVLRPGYEDGCGDSSEGDVGYKMGDNYTLEVVNALAEIIKAVQSEYPLKTTLFGHSGGAALSAILMNRHPDLANTALLAACPCDLKAWRQHMYERTGNERWISDLPGLSPLNETENLQDKDHIILFSGTKDTVTPIALAYDYLDAVSKYSIHSLYFDWPVLADHDSIIEDRFLERFLNFYK